MWACYAVPAAYPAWLITPITINRSRADHSLTPTTTWPQMLRSVQWHHRDWIKSRDNPCRTYSRYSWYIRSEQSSWKYFFFICDLLVTHSVQFKPGNCTDGCTWNGTRWLCNFKVIWHRRTRKRQIYTLRFRYNLTQVHYNDGALNRLNSVHVINMHLSTVLGDFCYVWCHLPYVFNILQSLLHYASYYTVAYIVNLPQTATF